MFWGHGLRTGISLKAEIRQLKRPVLSRNFRFGHAGQNTVMPFIEAPIGEQRSFLVPMEVLGDYPIGAYSSGQHRGKPTIKNPFRIP